MKLENGTIICNCCKNIVQKEGEISRIEFLHIEKAWGYFSKKDGEKQEFDICEGCYDKWTASFAIPAKIQEMTELV